MAGQHSLTIYSRIFIWTTRILTNITMRSKPIPIILREKNTTASVRYSKPCWNVKSKSILITSKFRTMKLSDKPTEYVLLKAGTNSEWDDCNFAIVHITEDWRKEQQQRLEMVKPFAKDYFLQSLNYYDTAVDFYTADEDDNPDLYRWLENKPMAYVEIDKDELEILSVPENRLDCYRLVMYKTGTAMYTAYGKHTSEEFWTEEFPLKQIIEQL